MGIGFSRTQKRGSRVPGLGGLGQDISHSVATCRRIGNRLAE